MPTVAGYMGDTGGGGLSLFSDLRRGMKVPLVGQLQVMLNTVSATKIAVDNDFGPETENAVKQYQSSKNVNSSVLRTDGVVDRKTWDMLRADSVHTVPAAPPSAEAFPPRATYQPPPQQGLVERLKSGFVAMEPWKKWAVVAAGFVAMLGVTYVATTKKKASLSGFVDFLNGDEAPKTCNRTPSSDKLEDAEDILPEA